MGQGILKRWDGTAWVPQASDSESGASGHLARLIHQPGSAVTYSTTSNTLVPVDAAIQLPTFTIPPTGAVKVDLSAWVRTTGRQDWGLVDTGGTQIGSYELGTIRAAVFVNTYAKVTQSLYVSGLTPGTDVDWRWGWQVNGSNTAEMIAGGSSIGAAIMEAWPA